MVCRLGFPAMTSAEASTPSNTPTAAATPTGAPSQAIRKAPSAAGSASISIRNTCMRMDSGMFSGAARLGKGSSAQVS